MTSTPQDPPSPAKPGDLFATTRWSQVVAAADPRSPESHRALSLLCESYWPPLYAYVRRRVSDAHEAQDLTQEFFARLLDKNYLEVARADRGRFRAFLLTAIRNFLANEWDRARALKRGGGRTPLSLDFAREERGLDPEDANAATPEDQYERHWAVTVLQRVLVQLEQEFRQRDRQREFASLRAFLTDEQERGAYGEAARSLGTTEGAARMAAYRMRTRYRELLRQEIAQTVTDPADVDDEIHRLFAAVRVAGPADPPAESPPKSP